MQESEGMKEEKEHVPIFASPFHGLWLCILPAYVENMNGSTVYCFLQSLVLYRMNMCMQQFIEMYLLKKVIHGVTLKVFVIACKRVKA
jgi:hypothetical protein